MQIHKRKANKGEDVRSKKLKNTRANPPPKKTKKTRELI